jgi:hypothetical protein
MDYKLLYECEMKRADKAEDELAALRAQLDKAHFQIATLGYVAGCDTTSGGPPPDYEAAREAILSLSRELDDEFDANEQMKIELAAMRAQVAELEAADEWCDPQPIPPPEQKVIRAIVYAHRKDNGNWSVRVPILKWQPATGLFVPPPPNSHET